MHLVIISGAVRPQSRSNTAKIIEAFRKGYEEGENTSEVWYLSDRSRSWNNQVIRFDDLTHRFLICQAESFHTSVGQHRAKD